LLKGIKDRHQSTSERKLKVLAVLSHRPEKVARILPYAEVEYEILERTPRKPKLPRLLRSSFRTLSLIRTRYFPNTRKDILNAANRMNPDIIIAQGGFFGAQSRLVARKLGKKFIMRLGGHIYDEYKENVGIASRLYQFPHYQLVFDNLREADYIIVVTQDMKDKLCRESGRDPETVLVVPVPINLGLFSSKKKNKNNNKTVLCITNLNFRKKLKAMQDFAPAIKDTPNLKVIAPGRYHTELLKKLPALGFVRNIEREYQKAAVFCYFSYLDGCPNVILEAWASKVPVVVNSCDWSRELIEHGETGFLVKSPTEARLTIDMLLQNNQLANEISEKAYKYLIENHTERAVGKKLGDMLRLIK